MFTVWPTYNPYRVLRYDGPDVPPLVGEDVYALQRAINFLANTALAADGILGSRTGDAIGVLQVVVGFEGDNVDSKAGVLTQRKADMAILDAFTIDRREDIFRLTKGQVEHESSYIMGNKSLQYGDGSYDAGVTQRNTRHAAPQNGFDPVESISVLLSNTRYYYSKFNPADFRGADHSDLRRWRLAAMAWNAPAYASYLAGRPASESAVPSPTAEATLEQYGRDVSVYLR
jgi:hypothetical protein